MAMLLLVVLLLAGGAGASNNTSSTSNTSSSSSSREEKTTTTTRLVFILGGQSNMGGRGGATRGGVWDGVVPPQCSPSPRILRLNPALRWEEAREPLHAGIDLNNVIGVGPGMSFAHAVLHGSRSSSSVITIGLVPCAQGATPITDWARGTHLYNRMIQRTRAALNNNGQAVGGKTKTKLAALLWYQGEADTIRRQDALAYTSRMEAFVRDLRQDLNMPNLLVIQVGLATGQGKFIDLVRQAQRAVNLPNVKYVDAKGLPVANDYTHLTTPAQVLLGKMLAKAYLATSI
ncbi:hypothetical protein PR202_gb10178 [Eleusine coracana subsp. coracana]|uniref:Sialate O-acetylesterase domain-containing protein n=1 Tax=Eleusine coracana subsp. coracana TaxID=191504 RepID=A0AAV5EJS3_ELECO|nr:hypothetical protein QOZ80_3BG0252660 [Eleusine coracana subsp. coracana]GJN22598.1 hypothetical protein PR202_gb10178 [Eleusine coracana subsp. coracana]